MFAKGTERALTLGRIEPGNLTNVPPVPVDLISALFLRQRVEGLAIVVDRGGPERLVQSVQGADHLAKPVQHLSILKKRLLTR